MKSDEMLEIIDKQDKINIPSGLFKITANLILTEIAEGKSLTIAFVNDQEIKELNQNFRNKDSITDVLSFPNKFDEFDLDINYLGDIVISAEQAKKQAIENNLSLELEIKQLILHGILHLCGYDHETDNGEMYDLELTLRDKLKIN